MLQMMNYHHSSALPSMLTISTFDSILSIDESTLLYNQDFTQYRLNQTIQWTTHASTWVPRMFTCAF